MQSALSTQCPPPPGSGWQKPPRQASPVPHSSEVAQGRSQEPLRQRAPTPHSLLKRQPGVAGGRGWQTPEVQHSVGLQSVFTRHAGVPPAPAAPVVPAVPVVPAAPLALEPADPALALPRGAGRPTLAGRRGSARARDRAAARALPVVPPVPVAADPPAPAAVGPPCPHAVPPVPGRPRARGAVPAHPPFPEVVPPPESSRPAPLCGRGSRRSRRSNRDPRDAGGIARPDHGQPPSVESPTSAQQRRRTKATTRRYGPASFCCVPFGRRARNSRAILSRRDAHDARVRGVHESTDSRLRRSLILVTARTRAPPMVSAIHTRRCAALASGRLPHPRATGAADIDIKDADPSAVRAARRLAMRQLHPGRRRRHPAWVVAAPPPVAGGTTASSADGGRERRRFRERRNSHGSSQDQHDPGRDLDAGEGRGAAPASSSRSPAERDEIAGRGRRGRVASRRGAGRPGSTAVTLRIVSRRAASTTRRGLQGTTGAVPSGMPMPMMIDLRPDAGQPRSLPVRRGRGFRRRLHRRHLLLPLRPSGSTSWTARAAIVWYYADPASNAHVVVPAHRARRRVHLDREAAGQRQARARCSR